MEPEWLSTVRMAEILGVHRSTLLNNRKSGYLRKGQHWRKKNPLSSRGTFLWERTSVLYRMHRATQNVVLAPDGTRVWSTWEPLPDGWQYLKRQGPEPTIEFARSRWKQEMGWLFRS